MTKYKKEEPRPYPDWGQLHTPPVPKTIEHYLADILCAATEIIKDDNSTCKIQNVAEDIITYVHRAWDLMPEESAIIELIKSCNFCGNKMPEIEYYLPCSRKRYCSTECLKNDQKKK